MQAKFLRLPDVHRTHPTPRLEFRVTQALHAAKPHGTASGLRYSFRVCLLENTQPSQAPKSTGRKGRQPVPEEFFRQPYSSSAAAHRLTARRQKVWDTYLPTHVLDIPRLRTDTSAPEATFDPVKIYGREAYRSSRSVPPPARHIVHRAAEVPRGNFLAVEVYTPGIADLLLKMGNAGVENVRVAQANHLSCSTTCLRGELRGRAVGVLPDPWHKSGHHKRRLVSRRSLIRRACLSPAVFGVWRLTGRSTPDSA